MNAEKILNEIKRKRIEQLRRNMNYYQAFFIGFGLSFFIILINALTKWANGEEIERYTIGLVVLLTFTIFSKMKYISYELCVEFKEEGVDKKSKKRALNYIEKEISKDKWSKKIQNILKNIK